MATLPGTAHAPSLQSPLFVTDHVVNLSGSTRNESRRDPPDLSEVLRIERPSDRRLQPGRAGRRSDAAVHERGHEPVQGRLPRLRQACLHPGHDQPEVHPCRRQAQRPGQRRLYRAPPHLLRNAGQLQLRRLLQEGRDHLRLGTADRSLQAADREALGDGLFRRRRGLRDLEPGGGRARRAHRAHRRQQGRTLHVRQLLDDGRHRPLRPLHRDLLRPRCRCGRWPPGLARAGRRPLHRDLEQRLHAVQPHGRRRDAPAAQAERGHRHGPGAPGRGAAACAQQLRDRHLRQPAGGRQAGRRRRGRWRL
mmetsp:Transcript_59426/g.140468  ORF Transcript_59426/g.140468 Transcript_59426/m.140468 type:complete len:307 (-) Transcript_59426:1470-2390(-)